MRLLSEGPHICNAFLMDTLDLGPYIVVTSHKPKEGTASDKMLRAARGVIFDVICLSDHDDFERLQSYVHVVPWRSRTAAIQQVQAGVTPVVERQEQPSLFNIGTLRPRYEGKEDEGEGHNPKAKTG